MPSPDGNARWSDPDLPDCTPEQAVEAVEAVRHGSDDLARALRWVIEHKSCSGFTVCWEAAPEQVRNTITAAWGGDPWANVIRPRRGDLEAATQPHPFRPSGEYAVAPSRAEVCDLCGLAQRSTRIHPDASDGDSSAQ